MTLHRSHEDVCPRCGYGGKKQVAIRIKLLELTCSPNVRYMTMQVVLQKGQLPL